MVWYTFDLQSDLIRTMAIQDADLYSQALREFRTLYTSEVVSRVVGHDVEITHDYATREKAIPLPATLSMLLGNRIAGKGTGGSPVYTVTTRSRGGRPKAALKISSSRRL